MTADPTEKNVQTERQFLCRKMENRGQVTNERSTTVFRHSPRLDSTSSSSHRRLNAEDQDYTGDFDADEDEDDWKPRKKKRRPTNVNLNTRKKKINNKDLLSHQPLNELDFHNCIIPLDKLW